LRAQLRARALDAYKDLLALWEGADPDILILNEAEAEYSKLPQPATSHSPQLAIARNLIDTGANAP
jgi:hypothetical protein